MEYIQNCVFYWCYRLYCGYLEERRCVIMSCSNGYTGKRKDGGYIGGDSD